MNFLQKGKSRRIRGAELVVTGGITMLLSATIDWLAPVALCVYGAYRWLFKKSYKDGIVSLAAGILLLVLFNTGPLSSLFGLVFGAGVLLLILGGILMLFPGKKDEISE